MQHDGATGPRIHGSHGFRLECWCCHTLARRRPGLPAKPRSNASQDRDSNTLARRPRSGIHPPSPLPPSCLKPRLALASPLALTQMAATADELLQALQTQNNQVSVALHRGQTPTHAAHLIRSFSPSPPCSSSANGLDCDSPVRRAPTSAFIPPSYFFPHACWPPWRRSLLVEAKHAAVPQYPSLPK